MSGDFGLPEPRAPGAAGDAGGTSLPSPPPGGRWSRALLGALVLVVLLGAGGVTAAVLRERPAGSAAGAAPSSTAPPSSTASSSAPPATADREPTTGPSPSTPGGTPGPPRVTPVVPGWQAVVGSELVAYDVPPTWRVEEADTITGFEYHDDTDARLVTMHHLASYRTGACPPVPGSARARAGFVSPRAESATGAAPELSQRWAEVAALQLGARVTDVSATQTVTRPLSGGGTATESTTLVRFPRPDEACQAPSMTVTAVSFEAHGVVVAFVLWTDEQVADAVTSVEATRVLRSLRVVG